VGRPEPYLCRLCRTERDFADHDDASYLRRKCPACIAAGTVRPRQLTPWVRIRDVPEYQDGEPAGAWRPVPGTQGLWERTPPDANARAAEVARRRAAL
jgi:hypothetical protein